MKKSSLSRQLMGGILLAEFLCAALFSFLAIAHEMHGRRRAFDVMLRGRADSLLGAVRDAEDPEDNVTVDPSELVLPKQDVYEVVSPSGRVLGQSPALSADSLAGLGSSHKAGYFNFKVNHERYRAIRLDGVRVIDREENGGLRRPVTVFYASPTRNLWNEAMEAVRFYVVASVLLLAGTGLALVWFLRRRLSPLQELAAIAGRVSARSWDFVPPNAVLRTSELAPIALSIEELLKGLRQSFEKLFNGEGDRRKFRCAKHRVRRYEVPRARRHSSSDCSKLLQRREAAAQEPDQCQSGACQQQHACHDVKPHGLHRF